MTTKTDPKAALALAALGAAFGAAFLFMKVLTDELSAFDIVAGRLTLAALVLVALVAVRGGYSMSLAGAAQIGALSFVDTLLPYTLIAWAEEHIDAGLASLLISTMPIFTVVFAMTLLPDERKSPGRLLALPLGVVGVVVLTGGDVLKLGGDSALGQLAVVGAACSYGIGTVYSKILLRTHDPVNLVSTKMAIGAVPALCLAAATGGASAYGSLSVEGWASIVALGVVSTAAAYTVYIWLVSTAGSIFSSLVTYVVPVFGVFLGWAVLGESIGPETAVGAVLIAAAVATVMYAPRLLERRDTRPSPLVRIPVPQTTEVVCLEGNA